MRLFVLAMIAVLPLVLTDQAAGQTGFESIRIGKKATGLIELNGVTGSTFCVDAKGLFITSAHVVETAALGAKARVVLQGGEATQKDVEARILRVDKESDLALLLVSGVSDLAALELGSDSELIETAEVTAFGYPFGRQGTPAAIRSGNPSVSVNKGRITTLPKVGGKLAKIMLDVTLNPGNSGGPVLDSTGKVIGVVQGGLRGAGINYAVPVSVVSKFLAVPTTEFEPPPVAYSDRHTPSDWPVSILSVGAINPTPTVEISLQGLGAAKSRVFKAIQVGPGRYVASVVPVLPPAQGSVRFVEITAGFESGQVQGQLADRQLKVGAVPIKLGDLALIERMPSPRATTQDGRTLAGAISGLENASITLGGIDVTLDLGKAAKIWLNPANPESRTVDCTVVVKSGEKELARVNRTLKFEGAPSGSIVTAPISLDKPSAITGSKVVRKLPAKVADVVAGGDGRYLFFTLKELKKIAVLDLSKAEVDRFIPIGADHALIAAGSEKLIVAYPETKVIQVYKIGTFERTDSQPLAGEGLIRAIAMGSSSKGPLLVAKSHGKNGTRVPQFDTVSFVDPDTLKTLMYYEIKTPNMIMHHGVVDPKGETTFIHLDLLWNTQFRASSSGSAFCAWKTQVTPNGLISITLQGKKIKYLYEHNCNGHVVPGPDGRTLYTGNGGLFSDDLKPAQNGLSTQDFYLPSTDPNYFLGLIGLPESYGQDFGPLNRPKPLVPKARCKVFLTGTSTPLIDVCELDEIDFQYRISKQPKAALPLDQRIFFNFAAKALVTIADSLDEVVIRRVDVIESLEKSGADYLFVTSIPPRTAFRRQMYRYPIAVAARQSGYTYSLSDGPAGMSISADGTVTWDVPSDFDADDQTVTILIKNASGQETFHTFKLRIR